MTGKLPSKGSVDDNAAVSRRARITWASEIEPVPAVWAWELEGFGRIPAGSLSIAAGREGTGKSSFGLWVAAKITHGELPGSYHGHSRTVLYVAVEDSWKHTVVPRLIAAGADLAKVARFDVVTGLDTEATLSLPVDDDILGQTIVNHDVAQVVIDPLMSVIAERIDTHREREVRRALDPLAQLADRTGAVILGIAHFGKGRIGDAASLITGSGAFKNVPRSIFGFARDEATAPAVRVMTQVKNSLGRDDLPLMSDGIEEAGRCSLCAQESRFASGLPSPGLGSKLENRAPDRCPARRAAFGRAAGGSPPQTGTGASSGDAS